MKRKDREFDKYDEHNKRPFSQKEYDIDEVIISGTGEDSFPDAGIDPILESPLPAAQGSNPRNIVESNSSRSIYLTIREAMLKGQLSVLVSGHRFKIDYSGTAHGITGPMNACKSDELIRELKRRAHGGLAVMAAKPVSDTRDIGISSKSGSKFDNTTLFDDILSDEFLTRCLDCHVIGIDEAQFANNMHVFITIMTAIGIHVVVVFLSSTYQMKEFPNVIAFRPMLEKVTELTAVCLDCPHGKNRDAHFSYLIKPQAIGEDSMLVGGKDYFSSGCRACFMDANRDILKEFPSE